MAYSFELFPAYEESFLLQNTQNLCFYQDVILPGTRVKGEIVCSKEYQNSLWIWSNFGQLVNWKTLECMAGEKPISMKKCDISDRKQLWKCVGKDIVQTQSGRYMYYRRYHWQDDASVTTQTKPSFATKWKRYSKKNVCSQGKILQICKHFKPS